MQTAHRLNNDADLDIVDDILEILGEALRVGRVGKLSQVENMLDVDLFADRGKELLFMRIQDLGYA